MTRVVLTGASGFIAKHILRELLDQGSEVRASVRSDKRASRPLPGRGLVRGAERL